MIKSKQQAQNRGFPHAAGPEDPDLFSLSDPQIHMIQNRLSVLFIAE